MRLNEQCFGIIKRGKKVCALASFWPRVVQRWCQVYWFFDLELQIVWKSRVLLATVRVDQKLFIQITCHSNAKVSDRCASPHFVIAIRKLNMFSRTCLV